MASRRGFKFALLAGAAVLAAGLLAIVLNWPHIVAWYEFRQLFESIGGTAQGYSEYRHRQTGIVFVHLSGGTFQMGAPETEAESDDNERTDGQTEVLDDAAERTCDRKRISRDNDPGNHKHGQRRDRRRKTLRLAGNKPQAADAPPLCASVPQEEDH